jgi:hypothetical protein
MRGDPAAVMVSLMSMASGSTSSVHAWRLDFERRVADLYVSSEIYSGG